jgi:putative hydroxymethylpyrimidine transport system substrate-binding protein
LAGKKINVFFPEEHGIPTYNELIFITHTKNSYDQRLPRFLLAVKKAVAYLDQHPEEAWQAFSKAYPNTNDELTHQIWFTTLPYFAEDPAFINFKEWEKFAKFLYQHKLIKQLQPVSHYAIALQTGNANVNLSFN